MAGSTFETNPNALHDLLKRCHSGDLQLPDFQRSWVWDEERIKSLIASLSRAFPVGAIMTLKTGGDVNFKPRPVEGAPATTIAPQALLLDGQQRLTSLYQVTLRGQVVETVTPKNKRVKRWFYIDMQKALDPEVSRDDAIIGVPEDRIIRENFNKDIVLDLSTREKEFEAMMYPLSMVFNWADWQMQFGTYCAQLGPTVLAEKWPMILDFHNHIIQNFASYQVPVIALGKDTSKEAVCLVFEKVNTGGKPLDAFELITAMYAADGHELRKDWYGDSATTGRHRRLTEALRPLGQDAGILANVSNTDFLQAISLFHTRDKRRDAEALGKQGKDLPAVSGNRQALLNLPLGAYKKYEGLVEEGFVRAAKFLNILHIYRVFDLPYQSQIVPLAAILADIGEAWEFQATRDKLVQWYWNGVFGELYGSAVDSRIARDFMEVPAWLNGGVAPSTVRDTIFRADRLKTMRMRLSAAYKGVNALLMKEGARDFRSGQTFGHTVFFDEYVDVHHIFPQHWCANAGYAPQVFDSIINKTPLSYKTNRVIGGVAPSIYLDRLQSGYGGNTPIDRAQLDQHLTSHMIDTALLRADAFEAFMADRQMRLLQLIEHAMGKAAYTGDVAEEGVDEELDDDTLEAEKVIA